MPATRSRPRRPASPKAAAQYADVGLRTIYRWIDEGRVPAWRVGNKLLRVDLDDVDQLFVPVAAYVPVAPKAAGR